MEKLLIEKSKPGRKGYTLPKLDVPEREYHKEIPGNLLRKKSPYLPELSEIDIARHFMKLSHLNYNIEKGIYPLGSCTMKYNPKINELVANLPGLKEIHPFQNSQDVQGALQLMYELSKYLCEITGFSDCTLQPAAGSHGEFTGINLIRAYHEDRGDKDRNVILIPDSAHGTNPASCAISGYSIISIKSNENGLVDLEDLKSKCNSNVAGFMLTNPNTLGLFESQIREIEKLIHGCGGLMYMDGANLNALLGIVRPADMGFDCMHINLHKTFSTPHGGGGPGAGPVCVNDKLIDYLPIPRIEKSNNGYYLNENYPKSIGKVIAFYGNFGVLIRAYTYIRILGYKGLREVSENAILNANYLLSKLKPYFEVPFSSSKCMHEFVMSGDKQKAKGVSTKDIAKRLLDYGFHAPTIYFPLIVHEAMLVEPTETENYESLNSFIDALLGINKEIDENPEKVLEAPSTTPVKRLDDALAARNLNIRWQTNN